MTPASSPQLTVRRRKTTRPSPPVDPASDPELQQFYEEWFMPLVRRAHWQHNLSAEDARDVVQDAFVLAIGKLDKKKNPKVWLKHVVDNLALNLVRKTRRRTHLMRRWAPAESTEREKQENE